MEVGVDVDVDDPYFSKFKSSGINFWGSIIEKLWLMMVHLLDLRMYAKG